MTPYQQLIELFAPVVEERNPVTGQVRNVLRSGKGPLAKAIGVSHSLVTHWETRYGGQLPAEYYRRIVEAAEKAGIPREKVEVLFAGCACPTCGRPVSREARP